MKQPFVRFDRIEKSYDGKQLVVSELNLDIVEGEFLTLLGPSGSGKTTTLMMLAGFETATSGEIYLDGRPINAIAPEHRNIGMVFQNYALFPHMSVAENVAFPLSVRGIKGAAATDRVNKALDKVGITVWQIGDASGFELLVRRSFIDHFWQLAATCSREFGIIAA